MPAHQNLEPVCIPAGRYYTTAQVAAYYGMSVEAVQNWIVNKYLPYVRIGKRGYLFAEKDLIAFTPPPHGPRPSGSTIPRRIVIRKRWWER